MLKHRVLFLHQGSLGADYCRASTYNTGESKAYEMLYALYGESMHIPQSNSESGRKSEEPNVYLEQSIDIHPAYSKGRTA
jgi:hypothetical protein